ncbi:HAD family hydrolase [Curtobacterium sp. MCPF17_052]|uniref:HAD family hydrolase n=1 Tax=Curtobacterium sp. MCPF17_052 TaxID=2175655 RepID=UPI0024DF5A52|nr:hypothetical protein [Curtobacterium sp. MCPF17_052]WIB11597.1 hypothetical protein DEJ36_11580 [Curtobacterium sp. MCPF17_052]
MEACPTPPTTAVLFDIDGTLADSNYAHIDAWWRAFRAAGGVRGRLADPPGDRDGLVEAPGVTAAGRLGRGP